MNSTGAQLGRIHGSHDPGRAFKAQQMGLGQIVFHCCRCGTHQRVLDRPSECWLGYKDGRDGARAARRGAIPGWARWCLARFVVRRGLVARLLGLGCATTGYDRGSSLDGRGCVVKARTRATHYRGMQRHGEHREDQQIDDQQTHTPSISTVNRFLFHESDTNGRTRR